MQLIPWALSSAEITASVATHLPPSWGHNCDHIRQAAGQVDGQVWDGTPPSATRSDVAAKSAHVAGMLTFVIAAHRKCCMRAACIIYCHLKYIISTAVDAKKISGVKTFFQIKYGIFFCLVWLQQNFGRTLRTSSKTGFCARVKAKGQGHNCLGNQMTN